MDKCQVFNWKKVLGQREQGTASPRGHRNFTATLLGHTLWVIGGNGAIRSIVVLDTNAKTWKSIWLRGAPLPDLILHGTSLYEGKLYVYTKEVLYGRSADLWTIDPVLGEFQQQQTYGDLPGDPYGQIDLNVCDVLGTMVLVGTSKDYPIASLWSLNLSTFVWTRLRCKGEAPVKGKHISALVGSNLFVHSGNLEESRSWKSKFHRICLNRGSGLTWEKLELAGMKAQTFSRAAMAYVGLGRLVLFGGKDVATHTKLNSLVVVEDCCSPKPSYEKVLSTKVRMFAATPRLRYTGHPPSARDEATIIVGYKKLVILGGDPEDQYDYYEVLLEEA